ncbi:MAG: DNRLRE domain-containing protein [Anaerolineales bacterium]|nr:DNRLRE domain-containing protein [Anaerolineales bacterium]
MPATLACGAALLAGWLKIVPDWRAPAVSAGSADLVAQAVSDGTVVYLPLMHKAAAISSAWEQEYHVPFSLSSSGGVRLPEMAVFWFGEVDPAHNYADVRLGFNDHSIYLDVAVIDRLLWRDPAALPGALTQWDAVSVYLNLSGAAGTAPGSRSYRLRAQASPAGAGLLSAERGDGSGWAPADVPFAATSFWRGEGFNNTNDDEGWGVQFQVPFTSLGLPGRPADGTRWALAVVVHDRDGANGPMPDTAWPTGFAAGQPASWGRISFGLPGYAPPAGPAQGSVTLRGGLNGANVPDANVGGYTTCGDDGLNKWTTWGTRVWNDPALDDFVNVQNQRDVSDWPCFSKYYLTFPLAGHVPDGSPIVSATLTLYQTGGSGGSGVPISPTRSLIQVMTVADDWDTGTLTWNNAPLALENVSQAYVEPQIDFPPWPGLPRTWDLSYGVARAVASGQSELRLALYSADGAIHSGKYFASSDTDDYLAVWRPTLTVAWGP